MATRPTPPNRNPLPGSPPTESSRRLGWAEVGFLGPVGVRTRRAISADLAAAAGDALACARLGEELNAYCERFEPFTQDGAIKPEWSLSMTLRNREVLEYMIHLAGGDECDGETASLLRRAATCFRGTPTVEVLRNRRTRIFMPRFWRCSWPVCPKSCAPGSVDFHRLGYYRDVITPTVRTLEDPEFWVVIPSIELPDEYSTKNLVQKAASYGSRQRGGIRWGAWIARQDGRHHPIIGGKQWLGEVSVGPTMGNVVSFNSLEGGRVIRSQTPPQLAFPMMIAVGKGAEFRPELMEQRWLRLRRNLDIGLPRLDAVQMSDL